jgi:hypothetical protein
MTRHRNDLGERKHVRVEVQNRIPDPGVRGSNAACTMGPTPACAWRSARWRYWCSELIKRFGDQSYPEDRVFGLVQEFDLPLRVFLKVT